MGRAPSPDAKSDSPDWKQTARSQACPGLQSSDDGPDGAFPTCSSVPLLRSQQDLREWRRSWLSAACDGTHVAPPTNSPEAGGRGTTCRWSSDLGAISTHAEKP